LCISFRKEVTVAVCCHGRHYPVYLDMLES
jgi:hypothetical protein